MLLLLRLVCFWGKSHICMNMFIYTDVDIYSHKLIQNTGLYRKAHPTHPITVSKLQRFEKYLFNH